VISAMASLILFLRPSVFVGKDENNMYFMNPLRRNLVRLYLKTKVAIPFHYLDPPTELKTTEKPHTSVEVRRCAFFLMVFWDCQHQC
jgi:hypothetical protein